MERLNRLSRIQHLSNDTAFSTIDKIEEELKAIPESDDVISLKEKCQSERERIKAINEEKVTVQSWGIRNGKLRMDNG